MIYVNKYKKCLKSFVHDKPKSSVHFFVKANKSNESICRFFVKANKSNKCQIARSNRVQYTYYYK